MRIVVGVMFAALALAACNKPADKTDAGGDVAAGPVEKAPVPPGIDAAPHVKAGLWEVSNGDMPGKLSTCIDANTQADSAALGQGLDRRNCSRSTWNRIDGGIAFDFDCRSEGVRVTSKGTVTGDFSRAYTMKADASMTKNGVTRTAQQVIEARYVGACPSGMKPGDRQLTIDGRTMKLPAGRMPG